VKLIAYGSHRIASADKLFIGGFGSNSPSRARWCELQGNASPRCCFTTVHMFVCIMYSCGKPSSRLWRLMPPCTKSMSAFRCHQLPRLQPVSMETASLCRHCIFESRWCLVLRCLN